MIRTLTATAIVVLAVSVATARITAPPAPDPASGSSRTSAAFNAPVAKPHAAAPECGRSARPEERGRIQFKTKFKIGQFRSSF